MRVGASAGQGGLLIANSRFSRACPRSEWRRRPEPTRTRRRRGSSQAVAVMGGGVVGVGLGSIIGISSGVGILGISAGGRSAGRGCGVGGSGKIGGPTGALEGGSGGISGGGVGTPLPGANAGFMGPHNVDETSQAEVGGRAAARCFRLRQRVPCPGSSVSPNDTGQTNRGGNRSRWEAPESAYALRSGARSNSSSERPVTS